MKFTEIFLSSAELCYCDRNKEMKPSRVLSEKVMAPHSSTLAWKIPWTEEPGGLQSMGSQRVGHLLSDFTFTFHFHALEKEMVTHSSVLAWRIPGTAGPGGLPSVGSQSRTWLKWLSSRVTLTFILTIKSSWKTTVDVAYLDFEQYFQLFQHTRGTIFSRGKLEENVH